MLKFIEALRLAGDLEKIRENKQKVVWYRNLMKLGLFMLLVVVDGNIRDPKVMVSFELNYFGSEQFQMACPSSESKYFISKVAEIYYMFLM